MVAIADDIDAKIRVVKPSGVMQRLASFGYVDSLQSIAGLADNWPGAVAVGQDETVFMTTSGTPPSLVAAGAGGALRRLVSPFPADRQLAVAADGSLLAALGNASEYEWRKGHVVIPDPVVVRIAADGSQTIVAVGAHDAQSFDGDGENPVDINIGAADVSVATDGGAAHRRLAAHQQGRRECLGQVADSLVIERRRAGAAGRHEEWRDHAQAQARPAATAPGAHDDGDASKKVSTRTIVGNETWRCPVAPHRSASGHARSVSRTTD